MSNLNDLEEELKKLIIESLALEDISPEEIESEAPLFNDGLGLDSIDALELGIALQKKYGIKIETDAEENQSYFASIQSLAKMVSEKKGK